MREIVATCWKYSYSVNVSDLSTVSIANCWNLGLDWIGSASVLYDRPRAAELHQLRCASCVEGQDVHGSVWQAFR